MGSENKASTHSGYRWRDELVDKLVPYVRNGVDRKCLNNLTRGYVPIFFPAVLDESEGASWLFPFSLGSRNYWWKKEIAEIGNEFAEESGGLDDNLVKRIFKKHHWKVDEPVEGISITDKRGRWKYDAYKDKVAVEVELSRRSQVFKDAFKLLIGQAISQIEVGIVMVRKHLEGKGKPYLGSVSRDWHAIYTSLPMLKIAFYGFPNKTGEKSPRLVQSSPHDLSKKL